MNLDFSKRRSARISSSTSDSESRSTKYVRKLQQNAPEKYQEYRKKRKREEYIPIGLQSGQNKDEIRHKWAAAKRTQRIRKKQSKSEENPSKGPRIYGEEVSHNSLKRFKDLNEVECSEYFRLKMASKRERRCHQKISTERAVDSRRTNMKKSPTAQLPSPPPLSTPQTSSENECGSPLSTPTTSRATTPTTSRATYFRKQKKVREQMPSTPRSYAKCVKNLMQTSTNSQQKQMKQEKIISPAFAKRNLAQQLSAVEGIQKNVSKLKSNPSNSIREFLHCLAHPAGKFR